MHQTYEILRHSPSIDEKKTTNTASDNADVEENYDELTSTGSFLSDLSDVSNNDDDLLAIADNLHPNKSLSMEFNAIFNGIPTKNPDKKLAIPLMPFNIENGREKTALLQTTQSHPGISNDRKNRMKIPSPLTLTKKFLHVSDNFTISKLCDNTIGKRSFNAMQLCDNDCNPIYEQIKGESSGSDDDDRGVKNNLKNIEVPKNDGTPVAPVNSQSEIAIKAHECHHTFSYQPASKSVLCFLCSKR